MSYRVYMEYFKESGDAERTRSLISGTSFDMQLIDPTIDLALNKAGKAEFTVPAQHPFYSYIVPMINNIEICDVVNEIETIIFFGRISMVTRGWNNQKRVTCEGAFAFFNDTIQRYKKYPSAKKTLYSFVENVLGRHNSQMTDDSRKVYIGNIELKDPNNPTDPSKNIENKKVYRLTQYETTLDVLTEMCIESEGGYMSVYRQNNDGTFVNKLDWVSDLDTDINQPAKFGLNLTDLNQEFDPDELYTALMPLGADYDKYTSVNPETGDNPYDKGWYEKDNAEGQPDHYSQTSDTSVTEGKTYYEQSQRPKLISGVTPGSGDAKALPTGFSYHNDYIQNDSAVNKYGFILKTKKWTDIKKKTALYNKAVDWLKTERFDKLSITCDVADLSVLDNNYTYDPFMIGKVVRIISPPHGIPADDPIMLPISEIHYDLNTGKKEVTIGTQPQVMLTRIMSNGNTKDIRMPDAKYDNDVTDTE